MYDTWWSHGLPGGTEHGQHEASAPRGPVKDAALQQGTAAATSSVISLAFDNKNSLFPQEARSKNIGQFPISVSFILEQMEEFGSLTMKT